MTHVPETGARKMEAIYGAGFWSVCHEYKLLFTKNELLFNYLVIT